jgi:hypothetical protein
MSPSQMIAWAPKIDPPLLQVSSILVHPSQPFPLDRQTYLTLLASRVQQLVSRAQDPQSLTNELVDQMVEDNLLHDPGSIKWQAAGPSLVSSNPQVEQRLRDLGLLNLLKFAKPQEMTEARQVINEDLQSPESRLLDWASALASH